MDPSTNLPDITDTHTAYAANPTPSNGVNHGHPPYAEMITTAIAVLKEKEGSSKTAIANYIEQAYTNLPHAHSSLLNLHLKRLKNSGDLVMVKHSYKLPRSEPSTTPSSLSKRGRGRPPKPMPSTEPNSEPSVVPTPSSKPVVVPLGLDNAYSTSAKRGRGRPPKVKTESAETEIGVAATKRSRGRPPKVNLVSDTLNPDVVRRVSVRPPKSKVISDVAGVAAVKRSRGRPPKPRLTPMPMPMPMPMPITAVPYFSTLPRPRGRPKSLVSSTAKPSLGRPRGRPPKYVNGNAAAGGGVVFLGIQPRRPLKVKKGTGRPVGRPRKDTALQGRKPGKTPDSTIDYAEVQDKLHRLQSKIKQVVGVIRPYVKGEESDSAMAALKELEDISNVDIMNQQQSNVDSAVVAPKDLEDISNVDVMNQQQPNAESEDSPGI